MNSIIDHLTVRQKSVGIILLLIGLWLSIHACNLWIPVVVAFFALNSYVYATLGPWQDSLKWVCGTMGFLLMFLLGFRVYDHLAILFAAVAVGIAALGSGLIGNCNR